MFIFLGFYLLLAVLIIIGYLQLRQLQNAVKTLNKQVLRLLKLLPTDNTSSLTSSASTSLPSAQPAVTSSFRVTTRPIRSSMTSACRDKATDTRRGARYFEEQFVAYLTVWIGAVALILAGFFLVKYSLEAGLLTVKVRIFLGALLGSVFLAVGNWLQKKAGTNWLLIIQALIGAGIAIWYAVIFSATTIYDLLPHYLGLGGIAIVTLFAVLLALRHGPAIAILGLVGGLIGPTIVTPTHFPAPVFFIYLYLMFAGLIYVIRRQNWWSLAIPLILGVFGWVGIQLEFYEATGDLIWVSLFLVAITATLALSMGSGKLLTAQTPKLLIVINYLALILAMIFLGRVVNLSNFTLVQWGLYAVLTLGTLGLAYWNQPLYGNAPWLALVATSGLLAAWDTTNLPVLAAYIGLFAALFIIPSFIFLKRSANPSLWAGLAAVASVLYYLLAYHQLQNAFFLTAVPFRWGILAFGLALLFLRSLIQAWHKDSYAAPQQQYLFAIFTVTIVALVTLAFTIELSYEFFVVVFAAQIFAISWVNLVAPIKVFRNVSLVLLGLMFFGLLLQGLQASLFIFSNIAKITTNVQSGITFVDQPFMQLLVPGFLLAIASWLWHKRGEHEWIKVLEISVIALFLLAGYLIIRHLFHWNANILLAKLTFSERAVITNFLFIYALVCLGLGRSYQRSAWQNSGIFIVGIAAFYLIVIDLLRYNPIWSAQPVGNFPIFNLLQVMYGIPLLWMVALAKELELSKHLVMANYMRGLSLLLVFITLSLNVRQIFHGNWLNDDNLSNLEVYTYSLVWLILGITLLISGILRQNPLLRWNALGVMLLTVAKVFLFDAAELVGFYRVLSFLGLGLSLLGLSYLYTRFVRVSTAKPPNEWR